MKPSLTATPLRRLISPFQSFFALEASGGIVLILCTAASLIWANSPWAAVYKNFWHIGAQRALAGHPLDLLFWVNDALMTLFFFVVGLEIKREVLAGELASIRQAALPIAGAVGGVLVPAAIYSLINRGGPGASGWGIPMATDIAFVIGVMALLGSRVPLGLKVFLTALAIVDDIVAVLVIAVFYTSHISLIALAGAVVAFACLLIANRLQIRSLLLITLLAVSLWYFVLLSGIHATIAGVLVALTIPSANGSNPETPPMLNKLAHHLHPWVTFVIMPLFALANAGVSFGASASASFLQPITTGVAVGLVFGKPVGITLASWLAVIFRTATLPSNVSWLQLNAAGWLGGIGFTMSLFIASLAIPAEGLLLQAKIGIFAGSLLAAGIGSALMMHATRPCKAG